MSRKNDTPTIGRVVYSPDYERAQRRVGDAMNLRAYTTMLLERSAPAAYPAQLLDQLLELALRPHYECDDGWFSCPESNDGCLDYTKSGCTCGANVHNEQVKKIYEQLRRA